MRKSILLSVVLALVSVCLNAQTLNPQQVKDALTKVFETEGYSRTLVSTKFNQVKASYTKGNGDFDAMYDAGLLEKTPINLGLLAGSNIVECFAAVQNPLVLTQTNDVSVFGNGALIFQAITARAAFEKITVFPETDYSGKFLVKYKVTELSQFARFCTSTAVNIGDIYEVRAPYAVSTDGVEVDWEPFKERGVSGNRSIAGIPEGATLNDFEMKPREKPITNFSDIPQDKILKFKVVDDSDCSNCFASFSKGVAGKVEFSFAGMDTPFKDNMSMDIKDAQSAENKTTYFESYAFFNGSELKLAYNYGKSQSAGAKLLDDIVSTTLQTSNKEGFKKVYRLLPEAEAIAHLAASLPPKYLELESKAVDFTKQDITYTYPSAQLDNASKVKFTFSSSCSKCNESDVRIFMTSAIEAIKAAPRNGTADSGNSPFVTFNVKLTSIDYNTTFYPSLTVKVDYELFSQKGIKAATLQKSYEASDMDKIRKKEMLLVGIAENLKQEVAKDIYDLVPVQTPVVKLGEPDKKGNIEEVYIGKIAALASGHYDVYLFEEKESTITDGLQKIGKYLCKGKIKPSDFSATDIKVRLTGKTETAQPVLKSGGRVFVMIAKNLK